MTLELRHFPSNRSPLATLDPRWKLAAVLVAALVLSVLNYLPAAALGLAGALVLAALARLQPVWYLRRIGALALFMVWFVVLLPWLLPNAGPSFSLGPVHLSYGMTLALLLCLKAFAIVTLFMVHLATTPLPVTLKAAHALHMPGLIVQVALLSYRYIFVVAGEFTRLRIALRVRGYRNRADRHSYRTIGQVSGVLLVRGYERAERVGQAMRCRGFDGRFRALNEFRTAYPDVCCFLALVAAAAGLLIWDLARR
ncbi:MAG TPA: cobalt ECF transporter T component CbiQ [Gemmataceae bacterium]|jgi:cobalt/nickel transport system permease protein|nr:cobalt ECF transporter T component CbiQ [Gemmataceae bacterium]